MDSRTIKSIAQASGTPGAILKATPVQHGDIILIRSKGLGARLQRWAEGSYYDDIGIVYQPGGTGNELPVIYYGPNLPPRQHHTVKPMAQFAGEVEELGILRPAGAFAAIKEKVSAVTKQNGMDWETSAHLRLALFKRIGRKRKARGNYDYPMRFIGRYMAALAMPERMYPAGGTPMDVMTNLDPLHLHPVFIYGMYWEGKV